MSYSPLREAIGKLPIPVLWQKLGLPGHVTGNCTVRSPLRDDDKNPSFSIFANDTRWRDHGAGTNQAGDSFDLYQAITKLNARQAWRPFIDLARR
jgi:hypothetical protein